jgi:hypothetical protein
LRRIALYLSIEIHVALAIKSAPTYILQMDPQDLEAFTQFLRMSDQNRKPPSFFETFKAKAAISVGLFAIAVAAFENLGFALE